MKFIKTADPEPVIKYLVQTINAKLSTGKSVLWLLPGGSAIKIAAAVSKQLKPPLKNLTITLTDERYGPVDHADSNWRQLLEAGFDFGDASAQPVLTGKTLDQTATDYSQMLKADLKNTDYSVALAGMGADGHIMGIKPKSPSTNSGHLAAGYKWDDFVRLTATPKFVEQLDEVVVYAMGLEKWPQFDDLEKGIKLDDQPAQVLKQVKKVTIFNDYKGEQQ